MKAIMARPACPECSRRQSQRAHRHHHGHPEGQPISLGRRHWAERNRFYIAESRAAYDTEHGPELVDA
ncbi:hypothetical protein [Streptomyces sp. P9-A2]|uniref:hypothetical protein n=1 Tax=Streptomyces sp. P9-A2 TaxID=3072284 RepID=UPI002FCA5E7B